MDGNTTTQNMRHLAGQYLQCARAAKSREDKAFWVSLARSWSRLATLSDTTH
jgi:hypothetical protein